MLTTVTSHEKTRMTDIEFLFESKRSKQFFKMEATFKANLGIKHCCLRNDWFLDGFTVFQHFTKTISGLEKLPFTSVF